MGPLGPDLIRRWAQFESRDLIVIIQHTKLLSICFFALNLKIYRILRFTILPTFHYYMQDPDFDNLFRSS